MQCESFKPSEKVQSLGVMQKYKVTSRGASICLKSIAFLHIWRGRNGLANFMATGSLKGLSLEYYALYLPF